jgi:AcrR family transcriptional regulator
MTIDTASVRAPATTRERLIAAAFAVVAREGLEGASVKRIAAQAKVTAGLLRYHFPTRDLQRAATKRRAPSGPSLAAYPSSISVLGSR